MDPITAATKMVAGLLLRLGLPILITAGVVWLFRRLDARWQKEAEQARRQLPSVPVERCWEERQCPPERAVACQAYLDQSQPCWQLFRDQQGNLQERCLACQLFQRAAVPAPAHQQELR